MSSREILSFCFEKGILIDKEILSLFGETNDVDSIKLILERIMGYTQKRIITKNVFDENKEKVMQFFSTLPTENQKKLEKLKISLGLSIEISQQKAEPLVVLPKNQVRQDLEVSANLSTHYQTGKDVESLTTSPPLQQSKQEGGLQFPSQKENEEDFSNVKIISQTLSFGKKIKVKDFFNYFRQRFIEIRKILQERPELDNLVSVNKISRNNQRVSIIGMVYSKRITKNNNILLEVEDLTGKIKVLVTQSKKEVYQKAEDITLDSIIGFKGSGNNDILFVNDIVFPDAAIPERKKSPVEENVLFISDLHVGSRNFMEKNFLKFIDYLNGKVPNTPEAEKIKYLFVVGDLIAGVGVYPNQEKELKIKDLEAQYSRVAELLNKIRKDIKIIILPGNHDCVRLMEPQPILDEKYAWPLYNLKNVTLTGNPSLVNIGAKENFSGFNVLAYHGFSYPYYANNIQSLISEDAASSPDKIMKYLLKNRHLAPTYASIQHAPLEEDELVIKNVPDIFVSGHTHKNSISYYNNVLIISNSCWEELMPYQEKMGFESDYCKVPMFNLKTRAIKILDFHEDGDKENVD